MFFPNLTKPLPDDRLLVLVQRRFYGEATQADAVELDRLLQDDPNLGARVKQVESDLRQNRVLVLTMKALTKDLDEIESEDLSAFMRTSRRNRELYESLQTALKHQAELRLKGKSEASS